MIRKATDISRHSFSRDDYHRMVTAGILSEDDRVELLNGEIVEKSPIGPRHNTIVDRLNRFFAKLSGEKFICRTQGSISLPGDSEPEPDLVLLRYRDDEYENELPKPADILLIIEVAETSFEKDRETKRDLYASASIIEYWVIDLKANELISHRSPDGETYLQIDTIDRDQSISPASLPNLKLNLANIL